MTDPGASKENGEAVLNEASDALRRRLTKLDPRQVAVWRAMSPAERLEVAFQVHQFALDAVRASERRRRYPFNVIEPKTGAKVDLVPLPRDPFTRTAFDRRQLVAYDEAGRSAAFITPEDIIVAKLVAHQKTESDKHLQDAQSVLMMQWEATSSTSPSLATRASWTWRPTGF
ncbi:MAG: hypothetical protein PVI07_09255 [Anaerolineae bacterium]|jgi:hypothetical protein